MADCGCIEIDDRKKEIFWTGTVFGFFFGGLKMAAIALGAAGIIWGQSAPKSKNYCSCGGDCRCERTLYPLPH